MIIRGLRQRRIVSALVAGVLMASGLVWAAQPSFAVHDNGMFELEGNTVHDSASTPPYDWASLFDSSGNRIVTPNPDTGPLLASTFVNDSALPDQSYFTSNKDIQPIASGQQHWGCDPINNPLAKDNLLNAYAALVQVPANAADNAGHTVLYLGSERGSNNGTSFAGFWLLKDSNVGCTGSAAFSGHHTDGDILVVSDYTNGGGTQDVSVYRWTGDDATGSPVLQSSGGVCGGAANDDACAIANPSTIATPWSPTSHISNTFVEAGLDLTALLGSAGGCFTTFMAETRSSDQLTATLKDFAGGQFNTCAKPPIDTTATPGGLTVAPSTPEHDVATISAVGNRPAPTGTISFFLCQPAQVTAAGCPTGGTQVGGAVTIASGSATSASTTNDSTLGKYCWRAEYTPDVASSGFYLPSTDTNAGTECFTVVHGSPTITTQIAVTGSGSPGLGFTSLGDTATLHNFVGTVTGETVTFKLYGPYATGVTPTCTTPIANATRTGTLSAAGVATTSTTYTPTAAGTYVWVASYPGDPLNDPIAGSCTDANESVTIVGATIDVTKSANPPGPVSAGTDIGFDITVHNSGSVPATGVSVTDNLPAGDANGGDLSWSLVPGYTGCSITGGVGSQVLTCADLGTLAGGASFPVIHVQSSTSPVDCGVVSNKATVATTNGTGGDSDTATVTVLCPAVTLNKTADAASVSAGAPIGFTVTASNSSAPGTGTATGVVINDPLPGHVGISWSIASGPPNCSITGSAPNQTLNCTAVDLAPGASESVHITSATVFVSCAVYDNIATLTATNSGQLTASDTTTVLCPNLSIGKTADPGPVNAGTSIGFTVTAKNTGPGNATGALISDTLQGGTGIVWSIDAAGTSGPLSCGIVANVLTCTGTLGAGQTEIVHITSPTTFESCGTYNNTATISSTVVSTITSNEASVTVLCADLGVLKAADDPSVNAGESIGFKITATNGGDGAATGALISDTLPTGPVNSGIVWTIDAAGTSGPLSCGIVANVLTCTGTLGADGIEIVHVTSPTVFASCATYNNTATLSAANAGPAVHSNVATTTVNCPALAIDKAADDVTVSAGEDIGFTITASNTGAGDAIGALINDPLPTGTGVDWVIDSTDGPLTCAINAGVLTCTGTLTAAGTEGDTEIVHISSSTVFASCKAYTNTATLTAANGGDQAPDASGTTTVLCPAPDITKVADADAVNAGEGIGFTVTASNADGDNVGTAFDVVINDPLPAGTGISWSIESGPPNCEITGDAPNQVLTCSPVDLDPGDSETIHVVSDTAFVSCATYDNTATLTLSNGPLTETVDASLVSASPFFDTASTTVNCPALALTKVADDATVSAGSAIGFTIHATNAGPGTAVDASIEDPLPSGTGVTWSIDPAYTGPGACVIEGTTDQALVCELGDLEAGADVTVHITSATTNSSCAAYDNTATLLSTNAPDVTAGASTTVTNCAGVLPIIVPPTAPLAVTGSPVRAQLGWALGMVVLGGLLLAATRRRRTS